MRRATYEDLQHELSLLFEYNPPTRVPSSKSSTKCPKLAQPPSIFYDKHLDERLTLKRVVLMPSITTGLSETVEKALKYIDQQGISLPLYGPLDSFPTQEYREAYKFESAIIDANSVARAYQVTVAECCMTVASIISLSPRASSWDTALNWIQGVVQSDEYLALDESYALQILKIPGKAASTHQDPFTIPNAFWDSMDGETRERLSHAARKFPTLAVWQIFAISREAEHFVNDIGSLALSEAFCHKKCSTLGYASAHPTFLPYAPDAKSTSWGSSVVSLYEHSRLPEPSPHSSTLPNPHITVGSGSKLSQIKRPTISKRSRPTRTTETRTSTAAQWPDISIPGPADSTGGSLASSLLQHAWSRSVHKDSTFIIFNCGNFERIGIRHRASQTLFLSDLIDVPNCKDPGYGKLHIGLYLSIIHDVLDRTSQICMYDEDQRRAGGKKRRGTLTSPNADAKRPKTRAYVAKELANQVEHQKIYHLVSREASIRNVVLVQLRYDAYNSPAPASFLRAGTSRSTVGQTYSSQQYISLVVESEIAGGATGIVHSARLEMLTASDGVLSLKVAVKFAFKPRQQRKLRHEFEMYEHLSSSGVQGIPAVFGLFKDTESETLALVMTHVGTCLLDREPCASKIIVSDPERAGFIRVFEDIHRAGVRHHDPRVENLMVGDDGEVAVIDFDKAELHASESSKAREMDYVKAILDGVHPDRDGWPSERTPIYGNFGSSRHDIGSESEPLSGSD